MGKMCSTFLPKMRRMRKKDRNMIIFLKKDNIAKFCSHSLLSVIGQPNSIIGVTFAIW